MYRKGVRESCGASQCEYRAVSINYLHSLKSWAQNLQEPLVRVVPIRRYCSQIPIGSEQRSVRIGWADGRRIGFA